MFESVIILLAVLMLLLFIVLSSRARIIKLFAKYKSQQNSANLTGLQLAEIAIENLNLPSLNLIITKHDLSDGYHAKSKTLIFSDAVAHQSSLSSIAVAAHELGHAQQDKQNNRLLGITQILGAFTRLTNKLVMPLLFFGIILFALALSQIVSSDIRQLSYILIYGSFLLFFLNLSVKIITIPLEYDASKKAMRFLRSNNLITKAELRHVKKILRAAAHTYIASLFDGILFPKKR